MSELGFVYFFTSTEARNAVKVYPLSQDNPFRIGLYLHQEHAHRREPFQL